MCAGPARSRRIAKERRMNRLFWYLPHALVFTGIALGAAHLAGWL